MVWSVCVKTDNVGINPNPKVIEEVTGLIMGCFLKEANVKIASLICG